MKNKNSNKGLFVLIVIICLAVVVSAAQVALGKSALESMTTSSSGSKASDRIIDFNFPRALKKRGRKNINYPYIARVYITGTIQSSNDSYDQEWLLNTIDDLQNDSNNLAMVLYIDSPGGTVYEADEAYLRLTEYASKKPLYAYFASLAASGGYYIGCSANYIMANRNCLTGSIGVIAGQFVDLTGLMDKYGVHSETIHAGRNKIMGHYDEKVTEEQRAIMQSIADECYDQFTGIVAESRKMKIEDVKKLADGRIYTAKQAKDNKLIDAVGSWDDMLSTIAATNFDNVYHEVVDYSYVPNETLYHYIMGIANNVGKALSKSPATLPEQVLDIIEPKIEYPAYIYEK